MILLERFKRIYPTNYIFWSMRDPFPSFHCIIVPSSLFVYFCFIDALWHFFIWLAIFSLLVPLHFLSLWHILFCHNIAVSVKKNLMFKKTKCKMCWLFRPPNLWLSVCCQWFYSAVLTDGGACFRKAVFSDDMPCNMYGPIHIKYKQLYYFL